MDQFYGRQQQYGGKSGGPSHGKGESLNPRGLAMAAEESMDGQMSAPSRMRPRSPSRKFEGQGGSSINANSRSAN